MYKQTIQNMISMLTTPMIHEERKFVITQVEYDYIMTNGDYHKYKYMFIIIPKPHDDKTKGIY